MPVLQDGVMESVPSWEELSDVDKANRVARRLLAPPKPLGAGVYMFVRAMHDLDIGSYVSVNSSGDARRWTLPDDVSGIVLGAIMKGCYGWMLKS